MGELERKIITREPTPKVTSARIDTEHTREGMRTVRTSPFVGISDEKRVIRITAIEPLEVALQRLAARSSLRVGLQAWVLPCSPKVRVRPRRVDGLAMPGVPVKKVSYID